MTAALAITTAVKAVPVKQVGYSGLMVPVREDQLLAQRWAQGAYNTDDLLAYSAVCGTGLDTVPFPGDVSQAQMERIYGDVAALAWKWKKPLSCLEWRFQAKSCYHLWQRISKEKTIMGALAWYELISLWGFAVLVMILDQKNWKR